MPANLFDDDGSYSGKRFSLGICGQRDSELGEALNYMDNWEIVYLDAQEPLPAGGLDVIIATQPETDIRVLKDAKPNLIRIGWISGRSAKWAKAPWLLDYDVIVAPRRAADDLWRRSSVKCRVLPPSSRHAARAKYLRSLLKECYSGYRIGIKCPAANKYAMKWGDYYFAQALRRAFQARGHLARVDLRPDWYDSRTSCDDVVIVLRGQVKYEPVSSQINLLWLISHPDAVCDEEFEKFDHVFVASESYARTLASRLSVPVSQLLQCSDPEIFHPPAVDEEVGDAEIIFVGNTRGELRQVVANAIAKNLPVSIFGRGWKKFLPPEQIAGSHIPNRMLHKYYGLAKIVLNDHWPDMERAGFISNRIFDVALCGGFIISKNFQGSEAFGGDLITYRSAEELGELCRKWLNADNERKRVGDRLRQRVLAAHTFSHRTASLIDVIAKLQKHRSTPQ